MELGEQIWGLQVKGQGHWERKCKNRFSRIPFYWFTSNQGQNNHRPIVHISSNTCNQQNWFIFL